MALRLWVKLLFLILLSSCGALPKEDQGKTDKSGWVQVSLNLGSSESSRVGRSGTGTRLTEFVVAVEGMTAYSSKGFSPSIPLDANLVQLSNSITTLTLPLNRDLRLFIYRYPQEHTLDQLLKLMSQFGLDTGDMELGIGPAIDFGLSNYFRISNESPITVTIQLAQEPSGKLIQSYIQGATVWADRLSGGTGNYQLDEDEASTISAPDGSYSLIPDYFEYLIVSQGGNKLDSVGNPIPAMSLLALRPMASQGVTNLTPLTTLVALQPSLLSTFETLGSWGADPIAEGLPGSLFQISYAVETYAELLSSGVAPLVAEGNRWNSLQILAQQVGLDIADGSLDNLKGVLETSVNETLTDLSSRSLSSSEKQLLQNALSAAVDNISTRFPTDLELIKEDSETMEILETIQTKLISQVQGVICKSASGESSPLQFPAMIKSIILSKQADPGGLWIEGNVSDDFPEQLAYSWSQDGIVGNFDTVEAGTAKVFLEGFDTSQNQEFRFHLKECGSKLISQSCSWIPWTNSTTCQFMP